MGLIDRIDSLQGNLERRFARLDDGAFAPPRSQLRAPGGDGDNGLPGGSLAARYFGGQAAPTGLPGFAALREFYGNRAPGASPWGGQLPGLAAYGGKERAVVAERLAATKAAAKGGLPGVTGPPHTGTGLEPDVARWAQHTQETFGGMMDPDIMLAIMVNESHGNPEAFNRAGNAWGLFQQVGLNSYDPEQQFRGAHNLAQQKLAGIAQSYKANGLNPDERTRARDFALAWAGHFDYDTGTLNPNSRDIGPGGQTAEEYAAIFLGNYDTVKAGRKAGAGGGGTPGSMAAVWGGGDARINQEYGVVDPSVNQNIYTYGRDYGLPQGHTGLDVGLKRGTQLYSPLAGVIKIAGTGGYFTDEDYGDDGTSGKRGEIMIELANGDQVILGHTSQINVREGQQVSAGQLVGLSGSAAGDHLHLEVRQKQRDGSFRLVNPHDYFGQQQPGGGAPTRQ